MEVIYRPGRKSSVPVRKRGKYSMRSYCINQGRNQYGLCLDLRTV
jgi:hypothetical protein